MNYISLVIKRYDSNQYLTYNSFKEPHWRWGSKRNSEKFTLNSPIMKRLLSLIPDGYESFIKENNRDDALVEEEYV